MSLYDIVVEVYHLWDYYSSLHLKNITQCLYYASPL